jgi:hypothetical protein
MAKSKDAMVNRKQAPVLDPTLDQAPAKSDIRQLTMRDHPVLSLDDLTER